MQLELCYRSCEPVAPELEEIGGCPVSAKPYMGRKIRATRTSCGGTPPISSCAAFIKERRIRGKPLPLLSLQLNGTLFLNQSCLSTPESGAAKS
jgi:hypothetical protein